MITVEDVIIERLIKTGINPDSYEAIWKKGIPVEVADKVTKAMEKRGLQITPNAGLKVEKFRTLLNFLLKLRRQQMPNSVKTLAQLSAPEFVKDSTIRIIYDKKLLNFRTAEGYLDSIFQAYSTTGGKQGVSPFAAFRSAHPELLLGKGGERTVYTAIADDIYPVIDNFVNKYAKGSVDRLTARLLSKKGMRLKEFSEIALDAFDNPTNPTLDNSRVAKMFVKGTKGKPKLIHFSRYEASLLLRLRQLAILNGTKRLMPNFETIDKGLITHIKTVYKNNSDNVFRFFSELTGEFTDDMTRMTRTFTRNLFKDRIGSLLSTDLAGTGTQLDIAMNILNGEDFAQGVKSATAKKYSSVPVQQMIANTAFEITDDIYTAAMGRTSIETLLNEDGAVQAIKRADKIVIPEIAISTRHKKVIPAKNMLMMDTYVMGWLDEGAKAHLMEGFSARGELMSSTAHVDDLNKVTGAFHSESASKAAVRAAMNFKEANEITKETVNEIDDANRIIEDLREERFKEKKFQKTATYSGQAVDELKGRSLTGRTDVDIKNKANEVIDGKKKGESARAWRNRTKGLLREAIGDFSQRGSEGIERLLDPEGWKKAFGQLAPLGAALNPAKKVKFAWNASTGAYQFMFGRTAQEQQASLLLEQQTEMEHYAPHNVQKRLDAKRREDAEEYLEVETDIQEFPDEIADKVVGNAIEERNKRNYNKALAKQMEKAFERHGTDIYID